MSSLREAPLSLAWGMRSIIKPKDLLPWDAPQVSQELNHSAELFCFLELKVISMPPIAPSPSRRSPSFLHNNGNNKALLHCALI